MSKSPDAFRTISEVAEWLDIQAHVLRFWESKFTQVKPVKRAGGRRYYRPTDMLLLGGIQHLLHEKGLSIKEAQALVREEGVQHVQSLSKPLEADEAEDETPPVEAKPVSKWVEPDAVQPPEPEAPRTPVVDRDPPEEPEPPLRTSAPPTPPPFSAPQPPAPVEHADQLEGQPLNKQQEGEDAGSPASAAPAAAPPAAPAPPTAPTVQPDVAQTPSVAEPQERAVGAAPIDTALPSASERPEGSADAQPPQDTDMSQQNAHPAATPPISASTSNAGDEPVALTDAPPAAVEATASETPAESSADQAEGHFEGDTEGGAEGNTDVQIDMPFDLPDAPQRPRDLSEQGPAPSHNSAQISDAASDAGPTAQQDFFASSTAADTAPTANEDVEDASRPQSPAPSGSEPSEAPAPQTAPISSASAPHAAPQEASPQAASPSASEDEAPEADAFAAPDPMEDASGFSTHRESAAADDAATAEPADTSATALESDPEPEGPDSSPPATEPAPEVPSPAEGETADPTRTAEEIARAMAAMADIIPSQDQASAPDQSPAPAAEIDNGQIDAAATPDMPEDAPDTLEAAPDTSDAPVEEVPISAVADTSEFTDPSSAEDVDADDDIGESVAEIETASSDMASPDEGLPAQSNDDSDAQDSDPVQSTPELTADEPQQTSLRARVVDVPDEPQGTIPAGVLQRLSSVAAQSPAQSAVLSEIIEDLRHFGQQR
ncbi:MerR family transcriptional regulator [Tritonibacter scottomollicae]|uniref:MerR family transcriptional regulator n=1 Tax=Tritonibacter scottomollicae TaxID=483013 RepID=UPI003AA8D0C1